MMQEHVCLQKFKSFGKKSVPSIKFSHGQVDRSPGVLRNKSTCTFVLTLGTNENTDAALVPVPYRSGAIYFFLPAFMNKIRITKFTHSTPKRVPDANPTVPESEPSRQLEKLHVGRSKFHLIGGKYVGLVSRAIFWHEIPTYLQEN